MGWFSSTTKIYVASTAYNLGGEYDTRINFLKTTVSRGVLTNVPSIADSLVSSQLQGPIMAQRGWFRWTGNHYPQGQISGSTTNRQLLTETHRDTIKSFIPEPVEGVIEVSMAFIDNAEISIFAERYFLANNYDEYGTNWFSDYDEASDKMKIIYEDLSEELIDVPDFKERSDYMYIYYSTVREKIYSSWVSDAKVLNITSAPDLTGADPAWSQDSYVPESIVETLTTTVTTVDHTTDPDTESSSSSNANASVDDAVGIHARLVDMGYTDESQEVTLHDDQELTIWKKHRIIIVTTVDDSDPNETVTTEEDQIEEYWETQFSSREIRQDVARKDDMLIYEMGSGNADLDSLQETSAAVPEFYPFIPLRYNNKSINHQDYADDYEIHAKTYNKLTGGELTDIIDSIEDNPSIGDVDHAFLTLGIELNTEEREGRRYIYEFMKTLRQYQNDVGAGSRQITKLDLNSTHSGTTIKYNTSIEWESITESFGVGQGKAGAAVNDIWWVDKDEIAGSPDSVAAFLGSSINLSWYGGTYSRLYWQVSDDVYSYLDIINMVHVNRIYKGKSVQITTKEALDDADPSGFVVPMHYPTIQSLPLAWANELANSNKILVFNSYQSVTTKWYQTGLFRIILMILIIVVVALIFPPAAPGLLGANLTVGATLGFAAGSTAALIAGAAANAIAAIVLSQVIGVVSVELFGEKWGKIIAAVVTIMIGSMSANYNQTGNFAINWGEFMRVDNLIGMTDSVASGVKGYAASEISDIEKDMAEAKEEYEDDVQSIIQRMEDLGYSGVDLDPLMYIQQDNSDDRNVTSEPSGIFLRRTLLTGSDIAEMTHAMIDDFVEISLTLPEANG
jgi:hypothetical protein